MKKVWKASQRRWHINRTWKDKSAFDRLKGGGVPVIHEPQKL
jgi:hypothetical protein